MIQAETVLESADNTGAKRIYCIKVVYHHRFYSPYKGGDYDAPFGKYEI